MRPHPEFIATLTPPALVALTCLADRRELIAAKGKPFMPRNGRRPVAGNTVATLVASGLVVITTSKIGVRRARLTPSGEAVAQMLIAARSTRAAVA